MLSLSPRLLRAALLVGLLALPAHLASAQDRVQETRSVASFTEIEYALPGTLHLRQGDTQSVEIDAPEAVLDKIETTVDGGSLEISDGNGSGFFDRFFGDGGLDTDDIDVYVTAPTINAVTLAGSGRVVGETRLTSGSLSLSVAGSGDMSLDLDAEDLTVRVAGSGECTLQGQASTLDVNIAGSGDLRAADLETKRADVRIAGSGDAELNVADRLTAEIIGSGNVRYRGRPTVDTTTLGSGSVRSMNGGS
jgi:hypothetical protein